MLNLTNGENEMNKVFVIGDTHFGHKKIIEFENTYRPFASIEEHDSELVRRWNAVVKPSDTVWHLGDVLFGREAFDTLKLLNGTKKLVMGNHDHYPSTLYLEHFSTIVGAAELRGCILTHIPVHTSQFGRYVANIHGHLHSNKIDDPRYVCVSAEHTNLTPKLLDTVIYELERMR
jgi:calcineurin-like phosphoesterase family protein